MDPVESRDVPERIPDEEHRCHDHHDQQEDENQPEPAGGPTPTPPGDRRWVLWGTPHAATLLVCPADVHPWIVWQPTPSRSATRR